MAIQFASPDLIRANMLAERARGERADVWHPSKQWALMKTDCGWLPLVACRELRTLRAIEPVSARMQAWTRMLVMGLEVHTRTGLGLDLNPANFAENDAGSRLFYVDEEIYATAFLRRLAVAIVSRIPEEAEATGESVWAEWGSALRGALSFSRSERAALLAEVRDYPLAEVFDGRRGALARALESDATGETDQDDEEERPTARPRRSPMAEGLVCVLADVHGNLPALRAVISSARERGATAFLFLGDAVGYGPHPKECVSALAELGATLVGGNHDHAIATDQLDVGMNRLARACAAWTRASLGAAEIAWLGALPREHREDGWMAVHGAPRDPQRMFAYVYELTYEDNLKYIEERGVRLCFHGHTHVQRVHATLTLGPTKLDAPAVELLPRNVYLVNPGSVGQPRDGDPRAGYALWDRASGRVALERVQYPIEATVRDILRAGLPAEVASRLQTGT